MHCNNQLTIEIKREKKIDDDLPTQNSHVPPLKTFASHSVGLALAPKKEHMSSETAVITEPSTGMPCCTDEHSADKVERLISSASASCSKLSPVNGHKILVQLFGARRICSIDKESLESMAEAIEFSGITSVKEAQKYNLQLIPPGPIMHTWFARYGTGIFDGSNNPPNAQGLDYVSRIIEQSERYNQWGIPLIILYAKKDMKESEQVKMRDLFSDNKNILMLCIEEDFSAFSWASNLIMNMDNIDDIRYSALFNFKDVLQVAESKALEKRKIAICTKISDLQSLSLIYTDIDNTFLRKPLFKLAPFGYNYSLELYPEFMCRESFSGAPSIPDTVSSEDRVLLKKHADMFMHETQLLVPGRKTPLATLKTASEELHSYLRSGAAEENFSKIQVLKEKDKGIFIKSCNYITLNQYAAELIDSTSIPQVQYTLVAEIKSKVPLDDKMQRLLGLQQIYQIHIGHDCSWYSLSPVDPGKCITDRK